MQCFIFHLYIFDLLIVGVNHNSQFSLIRFHGKFHSCVKISLVRVEAHCESKPIVRETIQFQIRKSSHCNAVAMIGNVIRFDAPHTKTSWNTRTPNWDGDRSKHARFIYLFSWKWVPRETRSVRRTLSKCITINQYQSVSMGLKMLTSIAKWCIILDCGCWVRGSIEPHSNYIQWKY